MFQHHTDRESSMVNMVTTYAPSTKGEDKKQTVQLPQTAMTHRTLNHPPSSSNYYNNSETNYSTDKKQLTTFEELKMKYFREADAANTSCQNENQNSYGGSCAKIEEHNYQTNPQVRSSK